MRANSPVAFRLEVVDAQQGVPADTDVDARLDAVFAAGGDKVAHDVAFAVPPFHGFQTIRIGVALPQPESGFMRGGQDGEFGSGRLGCRPAIGQCPV